MADRDLLLHTIEQQAERLALLRRLQADELGISVRAFGSLLRFLEAIADDHYSDGTTTHARVKTLAAKLGRSERQVRRLVTQAAELGLIDRVSRFDQSGRQQSSRISIAWATVRDRVANNPAPVHVRGTLTNDRGTLTNDRGTLTNVTPIIRSNPKKPEVKLRTGGAASDQRQLKRREAPAGPVRRIHQQKIADRAAEIFDAVGYRGSDGGTLWVIAAAEHAGKLSQHAVSAAIAGCQHSTRRIRSPVGCFRRAVQNAEKITSEQLTAILAAVRVSPELPRTRPNKSPPTRQQRQRRREMLQEVPDQMNDYQANERRRALLEACKLP